MGDPLLETASKLGTSVDPPVDPLAEKSRLSNGPQIPDLQLRHTATRLKDIAVKSWAPDCEVAKGGNKSAAGIGARPSGQRDFGVPRCSGSICSRVPDHGMFIFA